MSIVTRCAELLEENTIAGWITVWFTVPVLLMALLIGLTVDRGGFGNSGVDRGNFS